MLRKSVAASFALVLAAACPAFAAVGVGDKPRLEFKTTDGAAITSDTLRGKIVMLDFWATWCGPCVAAAPHMVEVNDKYGPKGLQIIGVSLDRNPAALAKGVKELKFTWPQHLDAGGKIAGEFGVDGIPEVVLIAPQGQVLWRGHPSAMDEAIERAFREHPPQLVDEKALTKAKELLDEIAARSQAGEAAAAMKLLARLPEEAKADPDTAARMDAARASLEAEADKMLRAVDPLVAEGRYVEAINRLKDLGKALAGTPAGASARKKLNELMARPEARRQAEAADRASRADDALAAARALQKGGKDDQAYARFKALAREFPGTPAATTAAAEVKRYEADKAFVRRVVETEAATKAKAALSMARSYKGARKLDQARAKYESVIADFPGTTYAATAKQELAALGK